MASSFFNPVPQFLTDNIEPLPGGKLNFFTTGTTTRLDTFKDAQEVTKNANPVVLDAAGRIPNIFLNGTYTVTLTNKDDVQVWSRDDVGGDVSSFAFADWNETLSYSIGALVTGSDGNRYESIVNSNLNNDPKNESAPTKWERKFLVGIFNLNVTYALNDIVIASDGEFYVSQIASNIGNNPLNDTGTN